MKTSAQTKKPGPKNKVLKAKVPAIKTLKTKMFKAKVSKVKVLKAKTLDPNTRIYCIFQKRAAQDFPFQISYFPLCQKAKFIQKLCQLTGCSTTSIQNTLSAAVFLDTLYWWPVGQSQLWYRWVKFMKSHYNQNWWPFNFKMPIWTFHNTRDNPLMLQNSGSKVKQRLHLEVRVSTISQLNEEIQRLKNTQKRAREFVKRFTPSAEEAELIKSQKSQSRPAENE